MMTLRNLHRWTGLTIGWIAVLLALTGAGLILRPQGEPVLDRLMAAPRSAAACQRPLDALLRAAQSSKPGVVADRLRLDARWPVAIVRFQDGMLVSVDRCSGAVLAARDRFSGPFGMLEYLHRLRFLPSDVARWIAGLTAATLALLLAIGGLWMWWPMRLIGWPRALRFDQRLTGRARQRNRHSVIGALVALPITVVAATGLPQAFEPLRGVIHAIAGSAPLEPVRPAAPVSLGPDAIAAAWQHVGRQLGAPPRLATVRLPVDGSPLAIEPVAQDAPHDQAYGRFQADPATGRLIASHPFATLPAGERAYRWMVALHMGMVGGITGQLLTLATMLAVAWLGWTGTAAWLVRRRKVPPAVPNDRQMMTVTRSRIDGVGIRRIRLHPLRGDVPVRPIAGAHLAITLPGIGDRHYSIANAPEDRDGYEIAVRHAVDGRGGSAAMHALVPGARVSVSGPRDCFPIDLAGGMPLLVAGGIGIVPMLSMARALSAAGRAFQLLYIGRDRADMAYLAEVAFECGERATIVAGASRAAIRAAIVAALAEDRADRPVHSCGPAGLMALVEQCAVEAGVTPARIHREHFAPPADLATTGGSFRVTLARSGGSTIVAADERLVDALARIGVDVPMSCEQGTCGSCRVGVLHGAIDHRCVVLDPGARARGDAMMPCVSRAAGRDLVLDI